MSKQAQKPGGTHPLGPDTDDLPLYVCISHHVDGDSYSSSFTRVKSETLRAQGPSHPKTDSDPPGVEFWATDKALLVKHSGKTQTIPFPGAANNMRCATLALAVIAFSVAPSVQGAIADIRRALNKELLDNCLRAFPDPKKELFDRLVRQTIAGGVFRSSIKTGSLTHENYRLDLVAIQALAALQYKLQIALYEVPGSDTPSHDQSVVFTFPVSVVKSWV